MSSRFHTPVAAAALAAVLVSGILLSGPERAKRSHVPVPPAPTEVGERHDERRLTEGRRAWIREMHRAAPGTDWQAIERVNGLALTARRAREAPGANAARGATVWAELGSRNLAGRMHCTALSAAGDSLYGGSSRGGVWKGDLNGNGWRSLSDNLWGGAHGLAVSAGPPETVTRITDSGLLHYSEDGGLTWHEPSGPLANITECIRVASDPSEPGRVYLLVDKGGLRRLYLSEDRGLSYVRIRNLGGLPGDFWIDRRTGGRVWLLEGPDLIYTDDQGQTWTPAGTLGSAATDVVVAGSEAGAPAFYAALRVGGAWGLHRSTDAGATWAWRHDIDDFWQTLESSITDPDLVMFGGVELWRSVNGGASFSRVNEWWEYYDDPVNLLHADLPGLNALWLPGGNEAHFIATDGGLYRSDDGVATVTNISLEFLGVSQYYTTHTTVNDPDLIVAGAQDQGYQRTTGAAVGDWRDFEQLISGDYGHLTSGDGTHDWLFSVYPGFVLVQRNEDPAFIVAYPDFPAGSSHSWMPYILADPADPEDFWFCGERLYRYTKSSVNNTWLISASAQDFTEEGGAYLTAFAISAADNGDRLAVTNSGRIWWSSDGGATWTVSADTAPSAHYFYGTALEFSPTVAGEAWVGGSGYSGPGTYRTTDGGVTWTGMANGLPATLVYDLAYEGGSNGVMYAATETGPYRFDPGADEWSYIGGNAAPLTTYWSVESVPAAGVIRFGTYGRGIWDFETQAATSADGPVASGRTDGPRLTNRPNPFTGIEGTTLAFSFERPGRIRLDVYDTAGRRVRSLSDREITAGTHSWTWDGRDTAGARVASGLYVARLEGPDGVFVRRMTRLR